MPRSEPKGNFSGYLTQLVGSLSRFYKSGSIFFAAELPNPFELRSAFELRIEMPSADVYTQLRAGWKARDYKNLPLKGICMLDDEIGTHNSLLTIRFVCKPLGKGQASPYPARLAEAIIRDGNDEPYGYIDEYSYSFYPDLQSKRARDIGYVRYDFHPHVMGDGDIGGHPYFHFHAGASGEEMEEVELEAERRQATAQRSGDEIEAAAARLENEVRLPTELIRPEAFLTSLEYKLAPKTRQKRIEKALSEVDWYYLMLDLTPQALKDRMIAKYGKSQWGKLLQSESCKVSMRKAGWHPGLFDDY